MRGGDQGARTEVRVLPVPAAHGYVASLVDERVPGVTLVRPPDDDGGWLPSEALSPTWVAANSASFDVLHVHFGFEGRTPDQLRELVAALRAAGRGLVLTVHDLENPHFSRQDGHDRLLDVLVPAADALVTLTPGAAEEVRRRWGRRAAIVPHPHVAPLHEIGVPRPDRPRRVVGLHLKSLRANLMAQPVLRSLIRAVDLLPRTVLRVDVHAEALAPDFPRHDAGLVRELHEAAGSGALDLRVHGRFDDADLLAYLRELDVSVLAYGHGTHSGWLELCHDVGTPVVAGRVGFLHQQRALVQVDLHDPGALAAGLERAMSGPPASAATAADRLAERLEVATVHRDLYQRVVAGATQRSAEACA
ncbi:glycosyltransferase family 1 protein [Blastococcus sp. TBT05-19]|uniref:glycosyltransferase n=1 Tax=Blastococcus sp. TBT05-19 TaxID=2250581 RepID=UPI000DEA13FC|nr:glycosyltransferase [Blastococcus sp. TBT05-19]RBY90215.1 glycosyltransferase family 1 protein [Blastococcus sp. TBT05-19]